MSQKEKLIPVEPAIAVITDWWDKDPLFHWDKSPAWVILKMLENVDDDMNISYNKSVSILQEAETSKMDGPANRGMRYIKDEWKKLYLLDTKEKRNV